MKRIVLLLILVGITGITSIGFAQGGKFKNMSDEQILEKMETRLDRRLTRLTKKLELTPQQVTRIREVIADGQTQAFSLRKNGVEDRKAKHKQMKAIRKSTHKAVLSYLSKTQKEKFSKMKKGQQHRKNKGMRKFIMKKLNLSQEQKAEAKVIFKTTRTEMKALKESGLTRQELAPKRKVIRKASRKKLMALLTPDQRQKLKTFRQNHRKNRKHGIKGKRHQ